MERDTTTVAPTPEDRVRRAYDDGFAAAARGEEAAPGCTTSAEGRAFLRGYIAGASARAEDRSPS
jgi:ribosome modulation factor